MNLYDQILRMIDPLKNKVRRMIRRCHVQDSDDSGGVQLLKVFYGAGSGQVMSKVPRLMEFGLSSRPMDGADAEVVQSGGNEGTPIVIACDDKHYRPTGLQKGESVVYNAFGAKILLKKDGSINLTTGNAEIKITPDGKVAIGNAALELMSLIDQLLTAITLLSTSTPSTVAANAVTLAATATTLKTELEASLLGSL